MEIYKTEAEIAKPKNWLLSIVVIVLVTFGVLVLLQGLALAIVPFLFGVSLEEIIALTSGGGQSIENGRMVLFFVQAFGSGLGFIVAAFIIAKLIEKASFDWESQVSRFNWSGFLLVLLITLGGMLFNSMLVDLNSKLVLPEFLSGLESWMIEMEDQLMEMTKFMTDFQNTSEFLMGLLVIGILAGVGEELFFRGVVQAKLHQYTGSGHLGVWITAIIFSAIHLQFYGFLPRMFLGAMFGYLYLYSGSLIYPILAHIFNNAFTVVMVYLAKKGMVDFDIEATDNVSYLASVGGFLVLLAGIYYFKKTNASKNGELGQSL
ncbi:CPBP family intramembrane glutamic endopeptidase [Algoriphagus sediminis]|uniref:CPBP family intramembrane metalloprotease n=1 Tax=Algoriphagus sediminis TaxID=3057113 RepID=A0ABT7YER0_9BACT|nr:CPBP family intramembrane glutamic endopeptidase [Algoriphagus sediminis]MDN3205013.1 CPBP family intramembrane metalloprotease [Algoriphagus sediminis]